MDEFPDEDEEFELMYGDELNMINEDETNESYSSNSIVNNNSTPVPLKNSVLAKRNLDFTNIAYNGESQPFPQSPNLSQISKLPQTKYPQSKAFSPPLREFHQIDIDIDCDLSKKRTLDELFGDIHDIDFEEENLKKKIKSDADLDQVLIDKILEGRRRNREKSNPLGVAGKTINLPGIYRPANLSYNVPKWPFVTITQSDGQRVYARCHNVDYESQEIAELSCGNLAHGSLLGASRTLVWKQAKEYLNKKETPIEDHDIEVIPESALSMGEQLWVDLYRPRRYIELLSDEGTNRVLLHWLKMWDKVVFNREPKTLNTVKANEVSNFNKRTGKFDNTKWKFKKKPRGPILNMERDEFGRPMQKIALLCGPPGLGKTTLAYTIARHAGYHVLEMNASDDRSPEAFKNVLENGTQMKAVFSNDNRPNCIILDEIDGAPAASIDYLLKFTTGTTKPKKVGKVGKPQILKRPIICICNDMYTPALRPLRQVAFVVNFPPTESSRLAERLLEISNRQNLSTDLGTLLALANKTHCDVRACLSVLQFFSGQGKALRLRDVLKSNIGQKDMQKGLFGVWRDIFQIQRPKRGLVDNIHKDSSDQQTEDQENDSVVGVIETSLASRMSQVLETVQGAGDYERLGQGVFENYLHMRQHDPDMRGVCSALQWFCFSDCLASTIHHTQNYSLYPYQPYGFVAWHFLFSSLSWQRINFPVKGFEAQQRQSQLRAIVEAVRRGASVKGRGIVSATLPLVLDVLPMVRRILTPALRSVSMQLLTPRERADLRHAVHIMADLGLSYSQVRGIDGTYNYQMEPDIEQVGQFPDIQPLQPLTYWSKQLIAREVEIERMRRAVPKVDDANKNGDGTDGAERIVTTTKSVDKMGAAAAKSLPNHLQRLQPKTVTAPTETISKDFFGRKVTKSHPLAVKDGGEDAIVKSPIWYHYKEGCNNAVRKIVLISDLL